LAAVVLFAMMLRPPIGEQPRFLAIGAKPEIGDASDAGAGKPLGDVAGQVEMRLA